ncbi:hypothetical protein BaRGS_00031759 [Batillaria attramentaria]|uniref:YEATS domain-containing protein n=1 Tax=Batillaria attramentaria TaxID=370345 RepID=A0ABD0JQU9_9CAEN
MAGKRQMADLDPDYEHEDVEEHQAKRQRVIEQDAKTASIKRIEGIVRTQFKVEIENKEAEVNVVDQRLHQARSMMDRLRAVVVASFYSKLQQGPGAVQNASLAPIPSIHPAVKKHIGKAPVSTVVKSEPVSVTAGDTQSGHIWDWGKYDRQPNQFQRRQEHRGSRFTIKKKIVVGNVSKFIPAGQREMNDQSSHKWMVYVRGPRDQPRIDSFVSKVWFFLHPSYRPNDLVEVCSPPFHLTRRGWGEFPVRVQLHFWDPRNKRIDIIHQLKLDKTCTGLQTLGAETAMHGITVKEEPPDDFDDTNIPRTATSNSEHNFAVPQHVSIGTGHGGYLLQSGRKPVSVVGNSDAEKKSGYGDDAYEQSTAKRRLDTEQSPSSVPQSESKRVCVSDGQLTNGELCKSGEFDKAASQDVHNVAGTSQLTIGEKPSPSCVSILPVSQETAQNAGTSSSDLAALNVKSASSLMLNVASNSKASTSSNLSKSGTKMVSLLQGLNTASRLSSPHEASKDAPGLGVTQLTANLPQSAKLPPASQQSGSADSPNTAAAMSLTLLKTQHPGKVIKNVQVPALPSSSTVSQDGKLGTHTGASSVTLTGSVATPVGGGNKTAVTVAPVLLQGPVLVVPNSLAATPGSASAQRNAPPKMVSLLGNVSGMSAGQDSGFVFAPGISDLGRRTKAASSGQLGRGQSLNTAVVSSLPSTISCANVASSSLLQAVSLLGQSANPTSLASSSTGATLITKSLLTSHPAGTSGKTVVPHPSGASSDLSSKAASPILLVPSQVKTAHATADTVKLCPQSVLAVSGGKAVLMKAGSLWYRSGQNSNLSQGSQSTVVIGSAPHTVLKSQMSTPSTSEQYPVKGQPSLYKSHLVPRSTNLPGQWTQPHCGTVSTGTELAKLKASILACRQSRHSHSKSHTAKWFSRGVGSTFDLPTSYEQDGGEQNSAPNSGCSADQRLQEIVQADVSSGSEPEKKIMVWKTKKLRAAEEMLVQPEMPVPSLSVDSYPDMRSLIRAAVMKHPLIDPAADKYTSPYCAKSLEQWLSWKTGKQRASEWMRSVTVRKYLQHHLGADLQFRGEQLWTTNHIMQWCRLHGLSPHGPGGHIIPSDSGSVGAHEEDVLTMQTFSSLSSSTSLMSHFTSLDDSVDEGDEDSEEVDIVSEDIPKLTTVKVETEPAADVEADAEVLPPSDEAVFVQEMCAKIGVKFQPDEIVPGVWGSAAEDMLFAAMLDFASDILQEAVGVRFSSKSSSTALTSEHVFKALCTFPSADFLTNQYCGVEDDNSPGNR